MSYRLRFLAEVEDDALSAYAWYEERRVGLGEEFLEAFYFSAQSLPQNPLLHEIVRDQIRRRLLPRFPYTIYYEIHAEDVIVIGLFHCARDPKRIESEVREREE